MSRFANTFLLSRVDPWGVRPIKYLGQVIAELIPALVGAGAEFTVQLPVEARPVVDEGP
jgi:hypothetical protein